VTVIEGHAAVHSAALALMDLTTAGWAFRHVWGIRTCNDDFSFELCFSHLLISLLFTSSE
jgi:hypothetical protein